MYFIAGLIRSPALYGLLWMPVCMFVLGVKFKTISDAATSSKGCFLDWFYASISMSLLAYPVLLVIHVVMLWFRNRLRRSTQERPVLLGLADAVLADFTNPVRGLGALRTMGELKRRDLNEPGRWTLWGWFVQIIHFLWALAVWGYFAFGSAVVVVTS